MSEIAGSSLLVTGGAGFVGSNLVRQALESGAARIVVVDNLLSAQRENVPDDPRVTFVEASASDDVWLRTLEDEFDYMFHLATYHGNQSSIHDPIADHQNNLLPTLKLLERVKDFKRLQKLVYSAAGCAVAEKTYDRAGATMEDAPVSIHMDSPYSISKIVGEFYCAWYNSHHGVPAVRARFQNVYGPGEILGAGEWRGTPATVWRNVTPTFVYKAMHGEPLPLEAGGEATRDFIFVRDVVRGLLLCATNGKAGDVYNIASGVETSIRALAELINELTGNQAPLEIRPKRTWDRSGKRFGSTDKAARELGFEASTSLRDGIRTTIEWTRQNLPLIERCMQKHAERMEAVPA